MVDYSTVDRKQPTSQLHTCVERKVMEAINFLEWRGGNLVRDKQVEVVGLTAAVLHSQLLSSSTSEQAT